VIIGMTLPEISMKTLRVASGLTQEDLAQQLGVSVSTVQKWEQGLSIPRMTPADMAKLVTVLKTDLATLTEVEQAWRNSR
jgi:DNA-binding transcriptional regulator YiaG